MGFLSSFKLGLMRNMFDLLHLVTVWRTCAFIQDYSYLRNWNFPFLVPDTDSWKLLWMNVVCCYDLLFCSSHAKFMWDAQWWKETTKYCFKAGFQSDIYNSVSFQLCVIDSCKLNRFILLWNTLIIKVAGYQETGTCAVTLLYCTVAWSIQNLWWLCKRSDHKEVLWMWQLCICFSCFSFWIPCIHKSRNWSEM